MGTNLKKDKRMKVEINEQGLLTIKAETPTERYALRKWCEENVNLSGTKIDRNWLIYYGEEKE